MSFAISFTSSVSSTMSVGILSFESAFFILSAIGLFVLLIDSLDVTSEVDFIIPFVLS